MQYALNEFKHIFGSVGEDVLDKNLLQNEDELFDSKLGIKINFRRTRRATSSQKNIL